MSIRIYFNPLFKDAAWNEELLNMVGRHWRAGQKDTQASGPLGQNSQTTALDQDLNDGARLATSSLGDRPEGAASYMALFEAKKGDIGH